jgi:hypothetical protein
MSTLATNSRPFPTILLVFSSPPVYQLAVTELLYDWWFIAHQFVLATSLSRLMTSNFIFQNNTCGYSPYVTSSLTRGWICPLQLLLVLASTVILRYKSCGTHNHILLSQIQDFPNLEDQVPIFISPRNRVIWLHHQALGFFSSPHRVMVEVPDPASILVNWLSSKPSQL